MQVNQLPQAPFGGYMQQATTAGLNMPQSATNIDLASLKLGDSGLFGISNGTLQGIGTLASVLGGLWSASRQADYQDKMYKEEKRRVAREERRQDKFEKGMKEVYK